MHTELMMSHDSYVNDRFKIIIIVITIHSLKYRAWGASETLDYNPLARRNYLSIRI